MALTPVIGQWRLHVARGLMLESGWYSSQCSRRVLMRFEASKEMKVGRLGLQTDLYRHTICTKGLRTNRQIHIDAYKMALTPVTGQCSHWTHIEICHDGSPLRTITHHRRGSRPITWWRDPSPSTIGRKPKNTQYTDHQTLARGSSERGETDSKSLRPVWTDRLWSNLVLSKAWARTNRRVHKRSTRLLIVHQKFFQTHAFDSFQSVKVHVYVL